MTYFSPIFISESYDLNNSIAKMIEVIFVMRKGQAYLFV